MRGSDSFLLVCDSTPEPDGQNGNWRFVLEHLDGRPFLEASDIEQGDRQRLSLWSVVRGLEALPGPSVVTLLTSERYVIRSLSDGLPRWRSADFCWEHFGQWIPVNHADLWRRIDRALDIHAVTACCVAAARPRPSTAAATADADTSSPTAAPSLHRPSFPPAGDRLATVTDTLRRWLVGQCGPVTGPSMAVA